MAMTTNIPPRILLAEDEEAMRTYLERALTNAGYEVKSVDRGTEAVPLLENEDFDLLLSDIVMPEMDGIELAQRCSEVSPRTKVMFITGFAAVVALQLQASMFLGTHIYTHTRCSSSMCCCMSPSRPLYEKWNAGTTIRHERDMR